MSVALADGHIHCDGHDMAIVFCTVAFTNALIELLRDDATHQPARAAANLALFVSLGNCANTQLHISIASALGCTLGLEQAQQGEVLHHALTASIWNAGLMIALAMGEKGLISRLLAGKYGGFLTFGRLQGGLGSAPGQPLLSELQGMYHVASQQPDTKVLISANFSNLARHSLPCLVQ